MTITEALELLKMNGPELTIEFIEGKENAASVLSGELYYSTAVTSDDAVYNWLLERNWSQNDTLESLQKELSQIETSFWSEGKL